MIAEGTVLGGRYRIRRPLGRGGMATAYLVDDEARGAPVALKLLAGGADASLVGAFRHEFAALAGLHHPHLARVRDFGVVTLPQPSADRGVVLFYTADFVEGLTLDAFAGDVRVPLCDALSALDLLHRVGLLHGDVKPENVIVDRQGRGTLIDLGCARPLHARSAVVSGTPAFLAPEVLQGAPADPRADLYALGITLRTLRALGRGGDELDRLAARLTRADAAERPADVGEVLEVLGVEPARTALGRARVAPRLLGREQELGRCEVLLDDLVAGRPGPRVLWVAGPEGVGKSRLLRELKWRAQLRAPVFEGFATAPDPIAEMIARARGAPPASGLTALVEAKAALVAHGSALVLVLDDAHLLEPSDQALALALARSLEPSDPILLVCAAPGSPMLSSQGVIALALGALPGPAIGAWMAGALADRHQADVERLTEGLPGALEILMARLAAGTIGTDDLPILDPALLTPARALASMNDLSAPDRRALGMVAVLGGVMAEADRVALQIPGSDLDGLDARGLLLTHARGWKLARVADARSVKDALPPALVADLEAEVARHLEGQAVAAVASPERQSALWARVVIHRARAGQLDQAIEALLCRRPLHGHALQWWRRAAATVADGSPRADLLLLQADLAQQSGRAAEALPLLARVLRSRPDAGCVRAARLGAALSYLKLGDGRRCLAALARAEAGATVEMRAQLADVRARALILRGDARAALDEARGALTDVGAGPLDAPVRAALLEDVGVAATTLGEAALARESLEQAAALLRDAERPRDAVRVESYRAFLEYRVGRTAASAEAHRRAVAIAERHDLGDQLASATLNLATTCHQLGDWGAALAGYERGLRLALALGKDRTAHTLRCNLAKLWIDLGAVERAASVLARAVLGAAPGLEGFQASLAGEIAMQKGDHARARSAFLEAQAIFDGRGERREAAEVRQQLAEVLLEEGLVSDAAQVLSASESESRAVGAEDVEARGRLLRGRLQSAQGAHEEARQNLREALVLAERAGQTPLQAEIEAALGFMLERQGATDLAAHHTGRAREAWLRIASTLPAAQQDTFWRHPRRTAMRQVRPAAGRDDFSRRLLRLLEINRRLNSSLETEEVLRCAMDAAIELTGAERGFLLLGTFPGAGVGRADGKGVREALRVAVARNIDREEVGRSRLKFSRGIAENVVRTGEPVLTSDAFDDERFQEQQSVHHLRLRSVVAVPIHSPHGTLGALYLDNRFQRGRFDEEDVELLAALADQVALALENARLLGALEARTRELDHERARVESVAREQADQIHRLTEEIRSREELEHRHDYGSIVGRSPALQRVFALLDRVIESKLAVLIGGESGTGKELVARAIHRNGPSRSGPFVSVNCAALPETLLESELFGHVRGAFTGADQDRAGLFVRAAGGTLFLDEIAEMPQTMQVKLLRALQEREVRPLGSDQVVPIDVRLVSATNRTLRTEVEAGRFREDLFYRIAVVEVELPPLRDRAEDIPELARHILDRLARELGRPVPDLSAPVLKRLVDFRWPGNVRQLENVLARAVVLAGTGELTTAALDLPAASGRRRSSPRTRAEHGDDETARILEALAAHRWNVSEVSARLQIPRTTLYRRLKRRGIVRG